MLAVLFRIPMKFILPFGWTIAMVTMLLLPGSSIPKTDITLIPNMDKLVHFALFAGFVFLWGLYLRDKSDWKKWRGMMVLLTFSAIALGVIVEFIQDYVIITRTFDPADILANSLGAICAAATIVYLKGKD